MPCAPLLPALVLPLIFKQTASSPLAALPASTRMPWRAAPPTLIGAATVLFAIFKSNVPRVPRPTSRMPLPSVWVMLLPVTVIVNAGVHRLPTPPTPLPPAMPLPPRRFA